MSLGKDTEDLDEVSDDSQWRDVDMINLDEINKVVLYEILHGSEGLETATGTDDDRSRPSTIFRIEGKEGRSPSFASAGAVL